ncbi:MAG: hypothetical protein Aurels2KO_26390 [Aureliella sp.]
MENPYQAPATVVGLEPEHPQYESFVVAAVAGAKTAVRWVTIIVAPILILLFAGMQCVFVYRGMTTGIWPEYATPQFWYSMVVFALMLIAAYLVACFWVGLFSTVLFAIRHLFQRKRLTKNAV